MGNIKAHFKHEKKLIETNYSVAWEQFKATTEYNMIRESLSSHGIIQPYLDNLIKNAFSSGFRMSGVAIEIL